jgi:hypothetical protein
LELVLGAEWEKVTGLVLALALDQALVVKAAVQVGLEVVMVVVVEPSMTLAQLRQVEQLLG